MLNDGSLRKRLCNRLVALSFLIDFKDVPEHRTEEPRVRSLCKFALLIIITGLAPRSRVLNALLVARDLLEKVVAATFGKWLTELGEHRISTKIGSVLFRPANLAIDKLHRDTAPRIAVLLRL